MHARGNIVMATSQMAVTSGLILVLICGSVGAVTFMELVAPTKIDVAWKDVKARDMLDLLFLVDKSSRMGSTQLRNSKEFIKKFLGYMSISPTEAQVGVILFDNIANTVLPLSRDATKCQTLDSLATVATSAGGYARLDAGLKKAQEVLSYNSRIRFGSLPVVVVISSGNYDDNLGDYGTKLKTSGAIIVVVVAGASSPRSEVQRLASLDVKGWLLTFKMDNFIEYPQLAYYLHKGQHYSHYLKQLNSKCGHKCSAESSCVCDSLGGNGKPTCACIHPGYRLVPKGTFLQCEKCPIGQYQDEKNVNRACKPCPGGQTTLYLQSTSKDQCVCGLGSWNRHDNSRKPLNGKCDIDTCRKDSIHDLDLNNVELQGSCSYKYGESCTYRCHSGYLTGGVTKRTCRENGRMEPSLPRCTAALCPILPQIANSKGWTCTGKYGNVYKYRTTCKNDCNPGYLPRIGTNQFVMCGIDTKTKTGKWSGNLLACDAVACSSLPVIQHARYNNPSCDNSVIIGRHFGSVCKVQCDHGYQISETVEWVCGKDGTWTNAAKVVICKDVRPPEIASCPPTMSLDNSEGTNYREVKLNALQASDNDANSSIKQSVHIQLPGSTKEQTYNCDKQCTSLQLPIGTSSVHYTLTDRSGNTADCKYQIIIRDVEPPEVVQCDGPMTDSEGFIYSKSPQKQLHGKLRYSKTTVGRHYKYFAQELQVNTRLVEPGHLRTLPRTKQEILLVANSHSNSQE